MEELVKKTKDCESILDINMREYKVTQDLINVLTVQKNKLRKEIQEQMNELNKTKVETAYGTFTIVNEYERIGVDKVILEKCYPNVFEKVKTTTKVGKQLKYRGAIDK